jgi:hypothetical protein
MGEVSRKNDSPVVIGIMAAYRVTLFYANGVPSSSPGLRGTRYPGTRPNPTIQPQRGCAPCDAAPAK